MKQKLTKRTAEALQPRATDLICWDTELPGWQYRLATPTGGETWNEEGNMNLVETDTEASTTAPPLPVRATEPKFSLGDVLVAKGREISIHWFDGSIETVRDPWGPATIIFRHPDGIKFSYKMLLGARLEIGEQVPWAMDEQYLELRA